MKKIRQWNDIDITVHLHNGEGQTLDPTLCKDMTVYLTCGSKKFFISEFEKFTDGNVKFRFKADEQTRIGVYNITVTATTADDRTFTTDVCDVFNLVACSCLAGQDDGEVNIETIEVNATFEISAWGMVSDIVTYDVTELWNGVEGVESREPVKLNVDSINKVFGSPDSLMYNLESKHVRFNINLSEEVVSNTDVTSSVTIGETEGYLSLNHEIGFLGETVVTCSYVFIFDKTKEPHAFTYGHLTQYTDADQITTDFIADEAVTTDKIADGAITKDKISDGLLRSLGPIIDKGTLNEGQIRSLCESPETGIFFFIDGERSKRCLIFKPYQPRDDYNFMCITEKEYGKLNIEIRGGDGSGHGGWESFADTTVTSDSNNPVSSKAVYHAIYSVLNTEV